MLIISSGGFTSGTPSIFVSSLKVVRPKSFIYQKIHGRLAVGQQDAGEVRGNLVQILIQIEEFYLCLVTATYGDTVFGSGSTKF